MVRSSKDAMAAALKDKTNTPGMCQAVTRAWFAAGSVGDQDKDGDADAVDGWKSEPASAKHNGDRKPPPGKPLAFSGGSKGHGHRCISWTDGKTRSTDMQNGRYASGIVGFATIEEIEKAMGVKYLGWSETISGQKIPAEPPPPPPPPGTFEVIVATNNVMSNPKNPQITKTLLASTTTPTVVGLQEIDPASFKAAAEGLPNWDLVDIPVGHNYGAGVMYDEAVWTLKGKRYVKQYDGVKDISYTRHICIVRLIHKAKKFEAIFMSFHQVTKGDDKVRAKMRKEALAILRKEKDRYVAQGVPVWIMGDYNTNLDQHTSADVVLKHGYDHIYFWNGKDVTGKKKATRVVDTKSDHDVFIGRFEMKKKAAKK